ncbi:eff73fd5-285f-4511-952f-7698999bf6ef [Sclerotinia trifoliorum]|uniref:Eff73fd5-285f-4511-952f-7698999bf6ef n=1 Tax=Sclerotinia trifoliorum TaxID=28548 RepID=A0A8H2ZUM7_9HELO|nr:eff73fd5-285f-4511-952f-7698999bf6ef [Sclerotinia trifoliorum]
MQLLNLTVLLGLAASVSAIDASLRVRGNCDSRSGGHTCTNLNPNNCCGVPSGSYSSLVFYAVPTNWFIEIRGHEGGNCGRVKTVDTISGATEKCLNNGPYTGAGYSFLSRKREGEQIQEGACSASETCTPVKPDQLFLADGQKYNIVDMNTGLLEELTELMENGSITADIPEVFKAFEISA